MVSCTIIVVLGGRKPCDFSDKAVSKWERGETLPDTAILVDLADVLETTVDFILTAGNGLCNFGGRLSSAT